MFAVYYILDEEYAKRTRAIRRFGSIKRTILALLSYHPRGNWVYRGPITLSKSMRLLRLIYVRRPATSKSLKGFVEFERVPSLKFLLSIVVPGDIYPISYAPTTISLLIRYGITPRKGYELLSAAASYKDLNMCRFLLDAGVSVDEKNREGRTPLFYAACCGNAEIVDFLLANGADPSQRPDPESLLRVIITPEVHEVYRKYNLH